VAASYGLRVGLKQWFVDLLSRGEAPESDPDALVEVGTVFLHQGPLTVEALRDAGIEATMVEAFDAPTAATTRARIFVRHRDAAAALGVLAEQASG
jgi:hypothetical protein